MIWCIFILIMVLKIKNFEENIYDLRKKNIIKMEMCVIRYRIYNGVIG